MEQDQLKKQPQFEIKKISNTKKIIAIFGVILLLIILGIVIFYFIKRDNAEEIYKNSIVSEVPTPTPMPFYEMTIPYLRGKVFKSNIENPTLLSSNESYKTYLTSYRSDGLKINALLLIPNTDRPIEGYPGIVFVHGYLPPTTYETNGVPYSTYIDYFAKNGYVVLKIDLRGHGTSEGEAGGGYFGADYVTDTLNAYAALQNYEVVNPQKIGLWGHSMAGNILLRSAVVKQNIPAIDIWGGAVFTYSDMAKYGISDNSYRPPMTQNSVRRRRDEIVKIYGNFDTKSPFWSTFAPTNYLKDIKGAIQLDHAVDDATVNIGYSRDLAVLLKENGVNYVLNEYPSGGHDIEDANFTKAMQNSVTFFNKYLKGD